MSKRQWRVYFWRPGDAGFLAFKVSLELSRYALRKSGVGKPGWYSLTLALLGFGVSLTYWRHPKQPDVYGDGGVA